MNTYTGSTDAMSGNVIFLNVEEGKPLEIEFESRDEAWELYLESARAGMVTIVTVPAEKVRAGKHDGFDRILAADATITIQEAL